MGGPADRKVKQTRGVLRTSFDSVALGVTADLSGRLMPDTVYPWAAVTEEVALAGTSTSDAPGQPGVQQVEVNLVDDEFNSFTQVVSTPGAATGSAIRVGGPGGNSQWLRINGVRATIGGATAQASGAVGTIDVVGLTTGNVYARINPGGSRWGGCLYTVPNDEEVYWVGFGVSIYDPAQNNSDVIASLATRRPGESVWNTEASTNILNVSRLDIQFELRDFWWPTGTDVVVRAESLAGTTNDVSGRLAFTREQIVGLL